MDYQRLLIDNLPTIEQVVRALARRHLLTSAEAEDLASAVKLKILENDYEVLRRFEHRSSLRTYFTVITQREFLDARNTQWGKWRPCLNARRAGPVAVLLDRLLTRDGHSFDEACELLRSNHGVTLTQDALYALSLELPERTGRRFVGEAPLATLPTPNVAPDDAFEAADDLSHESEVDQALSAALAGLTPPDRVLLKMRFRDGLPVSQIARVLQIEQKPLYRRLEHVMGRLRAELEARGVNRERVLAMVGHPALDLSPVISRVDSGNIPARPSSP